MNKNFPPNGTGADGCAADCARQECQIVEGEFTFTGPTTIYSFTALQAFPVFQIVDGVEYHVGTFGGKTPFQREFKICGDYVIRWKLQGELPDCEVVEPVFYQDCGNTQTIHDAEKITYCNTDTNTQWIKACLFTIEPDGSVTETLIYNEDTGFKCGEALPVYDVETFEYCNPATGTKWRKVVRYVTVNSVTTEEVISDTELGFPCAEAQIITQEYCIKK